MTYAVQQDLVDRFGEDELLQVADRDNDEVIDATVISGALSDADNLIDSYIAKRYDLPLSATPSRLVKIACDLARYFLFKDAATEAVQKGHDSAVSFLRDIAAGRAELIDAAGAEPAAEENTIQTSGPDRVFTSDTMSEL